MGRGEIPVMDDFGMGQARPSPSMGADIGSIIGVILIILGALIAIAAVVFYVISVWKLYTKAGRPGWAIFVPVYGWIEFFNIAWGNGAVFLFMFAPGINILVAILTVQKLSEAYGHGLGYTLGLFFFPYVFIPVLAFGKSKHVRCQAKLAEQAEPAEAAAE